MQLTESLTTLVTAVDAIVKVRPPVHTPLHQTVPYHSLRSSTFI